MLRLALTLALLAAGAAAPAQALSPNGSGKAQSIVTKASGSCFQRCSNQCGSSGHVLRCISGCSSKCG